MPSNNAHALHILRRLAVTGLSMLGLALATALIAFVVARPVVEARFPARRTHPAAIHDLAAMEYGPLVTASSYDGTGHHHPAFLVDRRLAPSRLEKWASDPADRHPWVEIRWEEPRDLEYVVLVQGAAFEDRRYVTSRYRLSCLSGNSAVMARTVSDAGPVRREALPCLRATGIRLDFVLDETSDVVRIYEVEAWGR